MSIGRRCRRSSILSGSPVPDSAAGVGHARAHGRLQPVPTRRDPAPEHARRALRVALASPPPRPNEQARVRAEVRSLRRDARALPEKAARLLSLNQAWILHAAKYFSFSLTWSLKMCGLLTIAAIANLGRRAHPAARAASPSTTSSRSTRSTLPRGSQPSVRDAGGRASRGAFAALRGARAGLSAELRSARGRSNSQRVLLLNLAYNACAMVHLI